MDNIIKGQWGYYCFYKKTTDDRHGIILKNDDVKRNRLIKKFICRIDSDKNLFFWFHNVSEFLNYYKLFDTEEKCFFEVILKDQVQKFYVDVDIGRSNVNALTEELLDEADYYDIDPQNLDQLSSALMEDLIDRIIDGFKTRFNIDLDISQVLIYESHSEQKRSYHVVINNYAFIDNANCQAFYDYIMVECPELFCKFIDNLYSSLQNFRMLYSQKHDSGRIKKPFSGKLGRFDIPEQSGDYNDKMKNSFITYIENCAILPDIKVIKPINHIDLDPNISEYDIETKIRSLIPDCMEIKSEENYSYHLKRISSGYCVICDRVHEHENALICYQDGQIIYRCWRDKRKYVCLYKFVEDSNTVINSLGINLETFFDQEPVEPIKPTEQPDLIKEIPPSLPSSGRRTIGYQNKIIQKIGKYNYLKQLSNADSYN
jgi:hypothetical protein